MGLYSVVAGDDVVQHLAQLLSIPIITDSPEILPSGHFVLLLDDHGLSLQATGKKAPGPVRVDFAGGSNDHRRQYGGGKGQMIAKAVGLKGRFRPKVLDVTAGLGQDGFVLASLGCAMIWVERSPVVYHLLKDGFERALAASEELCELFKSVELVQQNSIAYLEAMVEPADVIYLDPMFPESSRTAEVKKNMKAFHRIVGEDSDAGLLLQMALQKARYRVVVKRPRKAPCVGQQYPDLNLPTPALVFDGKSTRYDVYPLQKMPS